MSDIVQVKRSFDEESVKKMLKGALIAAGGAAALVVLSWLPTVEISNPLLSAFVVWFVPFAINAVKEWMKGE